MENTIENKPVNTGKLPPQALPLEEAVLGAIMLDKDAIYSVLDFLEPDHFYSDVHGIIYSAFLGLNARSNPIDLLTVTEYLKSKNQIDVIGGPFYLVELTNRVASAANIEFHARIIQQKYVRRKMISVGARIITDSYDESVDALEVVEESQKDIFSIFGNTSKSAETMSSLMDKAFKQMEINAKKDSSILGIPTGYPKLDKITGGWQEGHFIIIAGRPSMMKTTSSLNYLWNSTILYDSPGLFFSGEVGGVKIANRLMAMELQIDVKRIASGDLTPSEWGYIANHSHKITDSGMLVDDTPNPDMLHIQTESMKAVKNGAKWIMIDYIQICRYSRNNLMKDFENVSALSSALKHLARTLNVPVIVLSQLSRDVDGTGSKIPVLSNLRGSGNLEQDADIVMMNFRPEYYDSTAKEWKKRNADPKGVLQVYIRKNRDGELGVVNLWIDFTTMRLYPYDIHNQIPIKQFSTYVDPNTIDLLSEDQPPF